MSAAGNISDMCGLKELCIVPINPIAMNGWHTSTSRLQSGDGTAALLKELHM